MTTTERYMTRLELFRHMAEADPNHERGDEWRPIYNMAEQMDIAKDNLKKGIRQVRETLDYLENGRMHEARNLNSASGEVRAAAEALKVLELCAKGLLPTATNTEEN